MYLARGHLHGASGIPLWVDLVVIVVLFGLAVFFHFREKRK
ncbi:hypothetical protein ACIRLA_33895 [Streptomyces sp. NPDC102364]